MVGTSDFTRVTELILLYSRGNQRYVVFVNYHYLLQNIFLFKEMVLRTYLFTLCSGTPPTLVFAQSFKGLGCYGRGVNRTGQRLRGTPAQFFFRCGLSFFRGVFEGMGGGGGVHTLVFAQSFKGLGCYERGVNRTGQRLRGTPAQFFLGAFLRGWGGGGGGWYPLLSLPNLSKAWVVMGGGEQNWPAPKGNPCPIFFRCGLKLFF